MSRLRLRAVGAAVGAAVLLVHVVAAVVVFRLLRAIWFDRTSLLAAGAAVLGITLLSTLVGYRFGVARLLDGLSAVELPRSVAPGVYDRFDAVVGAMDVDRPAVLVAALQAPTALAVGGRRNGVVVLDYRLFRLLSAAELEAVFAHELAHLERADGFVGTLAFGLVRSVAAVGFVVALPLTLLLTGAARGLAWIGGRPRDWALTPFGRLRLSLDRAALLVLSGLTLLAFAHSRRREYAADDRAVEAGGDPLALARALVKLDRAANPRLSALSPLYTHVGRDDEEGWRRLVATHPPIRDRVERLLERADAEQRDRVGSGGRRIRIE